MARPSDTYTHDQFEKVDSVNIGGTVQCLHCKRWQGSAKVLNRKKAHLQNCPEYVAWRAAGNGQDLAPPNPYNATGRRALCESFSLDASCSLLSLGPNMNHTMQRPRSTMDMSKYFDEFFDDSLGQKCARVRCQSCGFVRAKNSTRQAEHLIQCKEFLSTTEGADLLTSGSLAPSEQQQQQSQMSTAIWNGARPHPDLLVNRRGPKRPLGGEDDGGVLYPQPSSQPQIPPQLADAAPLLAQHLMDQVEELLTSATQHTFLSQAGSGSLPEIALTQWLGQIGHVSRSLVSFTGALIGKIRIPDGANLERELPFRCLDFLCSAVNNLKKELEFLEATKRKYGLDVNFDEPEAPTKGFLDLFNSASHPSATLLEGMVMLLAVEVLFYYSFSYAGTFVTQNIFPPYLLPPETQLDSHGSGSGSGSGSSGSSQAEAKIDHIAALHEAFIENWKSENFGRFVDACKSIVDELGLAQTTTAGSNSREDMGSCERIFKQAVWLWSQMFPDTAYKVGQGGLGENQEIKTKAW